MTSNIHTPSTLAIGEDEVERKKKVVRQKFELLEGIACDRRLMPAAKDIAILLIRWFDDELGYAYAKQPTLAARIGRDISAVKRATKQLDALGIIPIRTTGKRGRATEYVPAWGYYGGASASETTDRVALAHGFGGVDAPVSVALAHPPNPSTTGVLTEVVEGAADAALAPSGARARSGIDAGASDFERVWRAFPKRVGRAAARKAFDTVMARGVVSVEVLVDKVQEYKAATAHFSDPKYIKQLANWFKDECWLEEWEPPRRKQPKLDRAEKANGKAKPAEAAKPELDDGDDGPPTFEVGARAWRDGRKGEIVRASHELFDDGEWRWLVDVQWPEGSTSLNLSGDDLIVEPLTPEDRAERARRAAEAQAAAEAQRARRAAEAEAAAEAERARRAAEEQAAAAKRERELAEMRERFPVGARVDRTWSRCGVSHVKKDGEVIAVGPDGVQVRNGTSNSTVPYEHIVRGELVVTSAAPRGATPGM